MLKIHFIHLPVSNHYWQTHCDANRVLRPLVNVTPRWLPQKSFVTLSDVALKDSPFASPGHRTGIFRSGSQKLPISPRRVLRRRDRSPDAAETEERALPYVTGSGNVRPGPACASRSHRLRRICRRNTLRYSTYFIESIINTTNRDDFNGVKFVRSD